MSKTAKQSESFRVVNVDGRPARIINSAGEVLATSHDGNWWQVVKDVEYTGELDNFITSLAAA